MPESDARERILEAACDLVAAEGIDDVRIARVAMRAGASTALVHHYFSTREELLEQALLHSFEQAGDERFEDVGAEGSPLAGLALAIDECLPVPGRAERDWVLWVELWLRAAREPDLRPLAGQLYARYREWMIGVIEAGVGSGDFRRPADVGDLADRAMAMLDGLGLRALLRDPQMDLHRSRALVADLFASELGIDPAQLLAQRPRLG